MTRSRVTIHDVARLAGVSVGTVSRALNDRYGVNSGTRKEVLEAAKTLGYQPDPTARELSNRQPVTVGLSVAHGHKRLIPFFVLYLGHLLDAMADSGLRVRDVPTGEDGLPAESADAYVLLGAHSGDPRLEYLRAERIPHVLVGHFDGVSSIAADDVSGGRIAGEHLLALGHEHIVHLTGDLDSQSFSDRLAGLDQALREAGAPPPELVVCHELTALGAYRALISRLATDPPSAVFAATDELASGCVAAAEDLGLRVPEDLSVIGFDDMPEVGETLTTIRQDINELARQTVTLLLEGLRGELSRNVRLQVELVDRGTTARRR
ncbi:MAG: LacI family DNA-binding transcriptional regulator [Trueperaceae bacterium]|nr:LacI family DNA-binding transcriptional regulator [Trueperaceae bacterium]